MLFNDNRQCRDAAFAFADLVRQAREPSAAVAGSMSIIRSDASRRPRRSLRDSYVVLVQRFTLTTDRLVLRPFAPADVDDVLKYASDEEFGRYVPSVPNPYERPHAEAFVAAAVASDWARNPQFAIVLDGRVIGGTEFAVDEAQTASLGYGIGRAWWGCGLATETARAVMTCAFATYDVAVMCATADARNAASRRVLEKVGMRLDGTLRQRRIHRGERLDECHYSILRAEWDSAPT